MRRALAVAAVAVLALAGCAGSDEPSSTAEESPATSPPPSAAGSPEDSAASRPSEHGNPIEIEIEGDRVEPRGERVEVGVGEPVTLRVVSDRPAELHVHSSPEQELEVDKGETMLRLTIETPGIVDVEEHQTGTVVIQLEVR